MTKKCPSIARRALILTLTTSLVATPTGISAQPNVVGTNAAVVNQVEIRKAGTPQSQRAVLRQRVALNDQVTTGQASRLQILLLDRSTFTVGANARLTIDRFVYDPNRNSRAVGASVTRGAFRFMSGRALQRPAGPVSVRTPVASIGIRGTIFEGVVGADAVAIAAAQPAVGAAAAQGDGNTATLIILRGPGPNTQGDTKPGAIDVQFGGQAVVLDRPNLALYFPGAGLPPIGPFEISEGGLQGMQQLLRTVPTGFAAASAGATSVATGVSATGGGALPPEARARGGGGGSWLLPVLGALVAAVLAVVALSGSDNPKSP